MEFINCVVNFSHRESRYKLFAMAWEEFWDGWEETKIEKSGCW